MGVDKRTNRWAQLITMRSKDGADAELPKLFDQLRAVEQPPVAPLSRPSRYRLAPVTNEDRSPVPTRGWRLG